MIDLRHLRNSNDHRLYRNSHRPFSPTAFLSYHSRWQQYQIAVRTADILTEGLSLPSCWFLNFELMGTPRFGLAA
jgi:hypothetical protein